jgi:uncharacterized protein (TIGR03437 family)
MKRSCGLSIGILTLLLSVSAPAQAAGPRIDANGVVNAADYGPSAAPGAIVSIFGADFTTQGDQVPDVIPLPDQLGSTSVEVVDGAAVRMAPLYYVGPKQINAQLPYGITSSVVLVRVKTDGVTSNEVSLAISPGAPRFFTLTVDGLGRAITTKLDYSLVSRANPLKSGDYGVLWVNSLGETTPVASAGQPPPDGVTAPLEQINGTLKVTVNSSDAEVKHAGLAPGWPGLYQVNVRLPFFTVAGDIDIQMIMGGDLSQPLITIPVEPNGFYWTVTAGKFPNGQTMNGVSGAGSALAWRQDDAADWGTTGLRMWAKELGLGASGAAMSGVALTLRNGGQIVFDNNGIETGETAGYYDNTGGAVADGDKPGLLVLYSQSNYTASVFAGYFRLAQTTTFDEITGYFDGNGQSILPFNPDSPYNRYRMNIWSNAAGNVPLETGDFVGDVFSSDQTAGEFSWSETGAARVFSDGAADKIFRLVYKLNSPITLPSGQYWFAHDLALPASQSGAQDGTAAESRTARKGNIHEVKPESPVRSTR